MTAGMPELAAVTIPRSMLHVFYEVAWTVRVEVGCWCCPGYSRLRCPGVHVLGFLTGA